MRSDLLSFSRGNPAILKGMEICFGIDLAQINSGSVAQVDLFCVCLPKSGVCTMMVVEQTQG